MHLSAAAIEAEFGVAASGWKAGETPKTAWWRYNDALKWINRAKRDLEDAQRRG